MESLFRRTIGFTIQQMTFLKERSAQLGISIADLVRRIVDEHREKH